MDDRELSTVTERVGLVVWHLVHGEAMQTRDVAEMTGLGMAGAWILMVRLSRVIPIYQDEQGMWLVCACRELEGVGVSSI
jgi:hypothetical protein